DPFAPHLPISHPLRRLDREGFPSVVSYSRNSRGRLATDLPATSSDPFLERLFHERRADLLIAWCFVEGASPFALIFSARNGGGRRVAFELAWFPFLLTNNFAKSHLEY